MTLSNKSARPVKNFDSLTRIGKVRRLRNVAIAASTEFHLDVAELHLLSILTNTLFRIWTTTGDTYVLRCCAPGWRTDTDLRSETAWLEALAHDTDIGAPTPFRAPDGDAFVRVVVDGISGPTRCMLMSWIPGIPLGKRLSANTMTAMGTLSADLHGHGATFTPPEGFTTRRMDSYLARGETDTLFGSGCLNTLPREHRDILERTHAQVASVFSDRYADPAGLRVIHNDLWHDNIKIHHGRLRPLDFEDTLWGYPVQDIAMGWLDLQEDVTPELYEPYTEAFRAGYERVAPWPERFPSEIDVFMAGRLLWVANYVATFQPAYLQPHIAHLVPRLETFLTSGRVRRAGEA